MTRNAVKHKLARGEAVFGPFIMTPHPGIVEVIALAGFDFCVLDAEHGVFDLQEIENCLRAADLHGLTGIVRPPDGSPQTVSKLLDAGAQGLLIPHCISAEQARRAVAAMTFGPPGMRGVMTMSRAGRYAQGNAAEFFRESDERILRMVQIEDAEALDQLDGIAATEGLDVVFVGPYDLSRSLRRLGEVDHPECRGAVERVISATLEHPGRTAGIYAGTPDDVRYWHGRGVRFFAYSGDVALLGDAARSALEEVREAVGAPRAEES